MAGLARCVCFVCFPRLSFVGFGGFPPGGEGKGPGRASGSGTWRGREGRASGKSIVWLQDRSRRQNKNLSEDLARSPSLPPSLSVCRAQTCGAEELEEEAEEEAEEERRLSGGQVQRSPQSAIQESHRNQEGWESRGAGRGRAQGAGQAGAEAGGPRSGRSTARVRGNQHERGPRRALRGVVLALGRRRRRLPRASGARLARSGRRRPLSPDGGRSPLPAGRRRRRSRRVGPGAAASSAAAAAEAAGAAAAAAGAAAAAAASHT